MVRRSMLLVALTALLSVGSLPASASMPTRADVFALSDPTQPVGTASLVRTDAGVSFTFHTTELVPGNAHTIWVVVYNNPEFCVDGCDSTDLSNPDVQGSSLWGAGNFTGMSGQSSFGGHRALGVPGDPALGEFGPGVLDPIGSEIHLVLRTHGPRIKGMERDQINSFDGGCHPGEPNEGLCMNIQFAKFFPAG